MAGSLWPRKSEGIEDPLTVKAIVLESGGVKLAYVLLDLIAMDRKEGDAAVALASQRTGIPPSHIVWAASHTHTGPYTTHLFGGKINQEWMVDLPKRFADAVERAHESRRPARMSRQRDYCYCMIHNRRLKFKDGREINTWLLNQGEEEVQCLGSAAPIDPEVGILSFDDEKGNLIAVLWHFTLHTNANFGPRFSADYPGIVAQWLREKFGSHAVPIFMPGAFADVNPVIPAVLPRPFHVHIGNELAKVILERMEHRSYSTGPIALDARKEEVVVPYRNLAADQKKRLKASQWGPDAQKAFRRELAKMRKEGETEAKTVIQAWRIGEVGFASLPGELFVGWGLKIKAESPFPWSFPVELGGDYLGYLVTEQAWKAGGYESLTCASARPSAKGVAKMTNVALKLLNQMHRKK